MLLQKEGVQIDEFILNDDEAYIITYEDSSFWTVDVSRKTGLVGFIKGTILPESVDRFEASYDGQKTKVYINYTDANGSLRREYAGETSEHLEAMMWVCIVNQIYFKRKAQELSEAAG